jgi:serine/threonine-protein kinase RsbW
VLSACIASILERVSKTAQEHERLVYQVQLAVHETCANIIEHAYAGADGEITIVFTMSEGPASFMVDLYDTGRAYMPVKVELPDIKDAQLKYGLFIIYQLMDEVVYSMEMGKNHWHLVKKI